MTYLPTPDVPALSRRDLLKAGLSLAVLGTAGSLAGCTGGTGTVNTNVPDPQPTPDALFVQPQMLESVNGQLDVTLTIQMGTNTVDNLQVTTRTYNGRICGPTIKVRPGDTLRVLLDNQLPANAAPDPINPPDENIPHKWNTTNLHTHGFHVSPNQDNVFLLCEPGDTLLYEYNIPADHPAGTFWYHPHKHGSTAMQLFGGMAGCIIIAGGVDTEVPEIAAAEDLVFVMNELNIDPNTLQVPNFLTTNIFPNANDHFTVNGQSQPRMQIWPGQVVRLRIVNATVRRTMSWQVFDANNTAQTLNHFALDGINFPNVLQVTQIGLGPGNRGDILLRLDTLGTYEVRNGNTVLAFIDVVGPLVNMGIPTTLPTPAALPPIAAGEVTEPVRNIQYQVNNQPNNQNPFNMPPAPGIQNFTINGVRFTSEPNPVVNEQINLGAVIEWNMTNISNVAHPHHIHIEPFYVTAINGTNNYPPPPFWADTIDIPPMGSVTCRQRFQTFPGMFVFHCHILVHEDVGMMQIVNVT